MNDEAQHDYGMISTPEAMLLTRALTAVGDRFEEPTIVEIGCREGPTARGIQSFFGSRNQKFGYWGVDTGRDVPLTEPFDGAKIVLGDSAEVVDDLPAEIHAVFIDGCHCRNHVLLDFLLYGERVVSGGMIVLHDTGTEVQGQLHEHGPDIPAFHCAVRRALEIIRPERLGWTLIMETCEEDGGTGMRVYWKASQ